MAFVVVSADHAVGDGALVVGQHKNGPVNGYAYSFQVNYPSTAEAIKAAMPGCLSGARKHEFPASRCVVVKTFALACVAVAMDPKDGTPGVGWGVEATKELAEKIAMAKCTATAGDGRAKFCVVEAVKCDIGKAP